MSDDFCPRQITFELAGNPGVLITATERDGEIDFTIDVENTTTATGDLRALFFHFNEAKLPGLTITGGDGLLTESRILVNKLLDLGDGATLAGAVKKGFDIGLEWGSAGGKKDDIHFPVHFTLSSSTTDLTLDDFATLLFGAKLDSVGGPGGVRNATTKLLGTAPWAPDARNDEFRIYEDGAADFNSPSKTPQAVTLNVLENNGFGPDIDNDGDALTIIAFHDEDPHGTLAVSADGKSVLYTPDLDFSGVDTFEYCVSDGNGGQDSATVTVTVQAVADEPVYTWSVAQGATINEMLITVTASQDDADSSEFLDRIVAGSLPGGWTLTPLQSNPSSEVDTISQVFKLTVPTDIDINDEITFTAYAKETSNGDEEDSTLTVPIEIDFTHNQTDRTFHTENQNIWGSGDTVTFDDPIPFLGLEDIPLNFDLEWIPLFPPAPIPSVDVETTGSLTFGFDTVIHLDAGRMKADLNVTVIIDTTYNKTTDTLLFKPSYILNGGTIEAFGPSGYVDIKFVFHVNGNLNVALDPFDWFVDANIDFPFPEFNFDETILHIDTDFTDTWDLYPATPGVVELTLSWPNTYINSGSLSGSDGADIAVLNVDVDAAAVYYSLGLLSPLDPTPGSSEDIELLAVDVDGYVRLIQELAVNLNGLEGTLTFEDGSPPIAFDFGTPLPLIPNFSSYDSGDGGTIGFDVSINPDVSLTSEALIEFGVHARAELLNNLPSEIVDAIDELVLFDAELPIADITVFGDTFDLEGFSPQSWDLFV